MAQTEWDWKISAKKAVVALGTAALGAVLAVVVDPRTQEIVNASGAPVVAVGTFVAVAAGARFLQDWLSHRS